MQRAHLLASGHNAAWGEKTTKQLEKGLPRKKETHPNWDKGYPEQNKPPSPCPGPHRVNVSHQSIATGLSTQGNRLMCRIGVPAFFWPSQTGPPTCCRALCSALNSSLPWWGDATPLGRKGLWGHGLKINQLLCCFGSNLWKRFGCKRHCINGGTIIVWQ